MRRIARWKLGFACLVLASCVALVGGKALVERGEADAEQKQAPATVEPTQEAGIVRITLTQKAAQRIGIQMAEVTQNNERLEAPYSALLYDASGGEWVHVSPEPLLFKRARVRVEHIEGEKMFLSQGPAAGTKVVAVGAAELYGTEAGL